MSGDTQAQIAGGASDGALRLSVGTPAVQVAAFNQGEAELSGMHVQELGQTSSKIRSDAATAVLRLRVKDASVYYQGLSFDVQMGSGRDWGGHGYATYTGRFLLQYSATSTRRLFLISEHSSYLSWGAAIRYAGFEQTDGSSDDLYVAFKSMPSCTDTACGWQPRVRLVVHDTHGGMFESATADVSGKPGGLTMQPLYSAPSPPLQSVDVASTLTVGGAANIDGMHVLELGQTSSKIRSDAATAVLRLRVKDASVYYQGLSFDVQMGSGRDWGGHGYATYTGRFLLQYSATSTRRLFLISEHSSYLSWGAAIRYAGFEQTDGSSDDLYVAFKSMPSCTDTACGWQPRVRLVVHDTHGGMFESATADVSGKPGGLTMQPLYLAPS